jgi:UDP-GlcNAc:undecaprenyl-phosphate GlcNAc-1-phosphate transferase
VPTFVRALLFALLVSIAVTPIIGWLALKTGALVRPVSRSIHSRPVPHMGGLAIFMAFVASALLWGRAPVPETWGVLLGGLAMVLLGTIDDFKTLSPRLKLFGQVVIAVLVVLYFDLRISFVTNPLTGGYILLGAWGIPLTVLWMVAMVNVMNLVDGLDGLAAGISTIASLTLLMVAFKAGQAHVMILAAALAGSTLGFLPYNFNPAKIFMGDSGAMFLGFTLAAVAVEGTLKSAATLALAVPVLTLGLPIFDTAFAIVRRVANGRSISEADRGHLHHRLLERGLTQRRACLVMYSISACLSGSALLLISNPQAAVGALPVVFIALYLVGMRAGLLGLRDDKDKHRCEGR